MVYTRGVAHDFDRWAELGNYNWSYEAVLPYFKKSEHMTDPVLSANGNFFFIFVKIASEKKTILSFTVWEDIQKQTFSNTQLYIIGYSYFICCIHKFMKTNYEMFTSLSLKKV